MTSTGESSIAGRRTLFIGVFAAYGILVLSTIQLGIVLAILVRKNGFDSLDTWLILVIVAVSPQLGEYVIISLSAVH